MSTLMKRLITGRQSRSHPEHGISKTQDSSGRRSATPRRPDELRRRSGARWRPTRLKHCCPFAPVFEELFFRGALYRNLRQTFGRWGVLGSVVIAVLVNSVVFAAIHPQGLIFIPVLGSLAVAFTLMREWRGTINASIVAHAINNFVVLTLNVLMLRH
jgi:hypothetical protein